MTADPLSPDHGPGSRPSAAPPIWDEVNQRRNDKRLYVLGHLLNQQLGGPGDRVENLTPITFSANATHQSQVENDLKTLVNDERKMAHYELIVNYPSSRQPVPASFVPPAGSPAEGELATSFTARWWEVVPKNDDPKQLEMKGSKHEVPPITNVPPFPQT